MKYQVQMKNQRNSTLFTLITSPKEQYVDTLDKMRNCMSCEKHSSMVIFMFDGLSSACWVGPTNFETFTEWNTSCRIEWFCLKLSQTLHRKIKNNMGLFWPSWLHRIIKVYCWHNSIELCLPMCVCVGGIWLWNIIDKNSAFWEFIFHFYNYWQF